MSDSPTPVTSLTPGETATWLNIDEFALHSLVKARFIAQENSGEFLLTEVKAFAARNSTSDGSIQQAGDFQDIIEALDEEVDEFAQLAHAMFSNAVLEAKQWSESQRNEFVTQARARFGAILAVMSQGAQVDAALRRDLEDVGASAAWAGASLPHLELLVRS